MNIPWVESPFFEEILNTKKLSSQQESMARSYHNDGYLIVPNLFSENLINKVQEETAVKAFNTAYPIKTYRTSTRVQDFWTESEPCRQLAIHPKVLAILEMLYGREAIPFQTLNFRKGTQQRGHSDSIHFSSLPARYMCGVWVALEDITPDNGPLFYYPGSQKLPEYNFSHFLESLDGASHDNYTKYEDFIQQIMTKSSFEKKYFYAKKGDALIWSSNIIHGGAPVMKEGSSRWSQVTHYFFKDCLYYTPMLSNMVTNQLFLRKNLVNIKNNEKVEQNYNGQKVNTIHTGGNKYILNNNTKLGQSTYLYLPSSLMKLVANLKRKFKSN